MKTIIDLQKAVGFPSDGIFKQSISGSTIEVLLNDYAEKITYEIEKLKNADIPKAVKSTQLSMGNNTAIKITSKLSYEDFIKKYIIKGKNNE